MEAPTKPLGQPLILAPMAQAQQFQKRAQFSVWQILTNPFYMMMFFMAVMIFVVPRTMEAMDPEERKAMQARARVCRGSSRWQRTIISMATCSAWRAAVVSGPSVSHTAAGGAAAEGAVQTFRAYFTF